MDWIGLSWREKLPSDSEPVSRNREGDGCGRDPCWIRCCGLECVLMIS